MKNRWGKLSRTLNAGLKQNQNQFVSDDFENLVLDPEQLKGLLLKQSPRIYAALNTYLGKCSTEWMTQFLECDPLYIMFNLIQFLGSKRGASFSDTVLELQVITVIKTILNSRTGLNFLLQERNAVVLQLALGILLSLLA